MPAHVLMPNGLPGNASQQLSAQADGFNAWETLVLQQLLQHSVEYTATEFQCQAKHCYCHCVPSLQSWQSSLQCRQRLTAYSHLLAAFTGTVVLR